MLDYYMKEVRVHLELAVPVWHSGLTLKLSADIERVQPLAVSILVSNACAILGLKPLSIRRLELCERFAVKTASDKSRHKDLFKQVRNGAREAKTDKRLYSCMIQLIVNADTKFTCKIIATFSVLLHERILQILSLLTHTISFSTLHTVQQTAQQTVQQTVQLFVLYRKVIISEKL